MAGTLVLDLVGLDDTLVSCFRFITIGLDGMKFKAFEKIMPKFMHGLFFMADEAAELKAKNESKASEVRNFFKFKRAEKGEEGDWFNFAFMRLKCPPKRKELSC